MVRKYIGFLLLLTAQVILLGHSIVPHHHHHTHPAGAASSGHHGHPHRDLPLAGHHHGSEGDTGLGDLFAFLMHADDALFTASSRASLQVPDTGISLFLISFSWTMADSGVLSPPARPPQLHHAIFLSGPHRSAKGLRAPPAFIG